MNKRLAIPVLILCVAIVAAVFAVWATALEPADLGELSALYDAYDAAEGDGEKSKVLETADRHIDGFINRLKSAESKNEN